MLLVDSGDVFHNLVTLSEPQRQLVSDRAFAYVDVFNKTGHDAQGVGDRDLSIGIADLKDLDKKANFPFLSSNIVDAQSGKPVFKERVVLEKGEVKVGVFSLLTPEYRMRERHEKDNGIKILDPITVAQEQVSALKKEGAQVIVVLSHLTLEESQTIAEKVPGITAMLGSQSQKLQRHPLSVGNTYITDGYMKGKYLSVLTLFVDPSDSSYVFVDPNKRAALESAIQKLEVRIQSRKKAISAGKERTTGRPGGGNTQWLEKNLAEAEAEIVEAREALASIQDENIEGRSFVAYDLPAMTKTIADDEAVASVLSRLKKKYPDLKPGK